MFYISFLCFYVVFYYFLVRIQYFMECRYSAYKKCSPPWRFSPFIVVQHWIMVNLIRLFFIWSTEKDFCMSKWKQISTKWILFKVTVSLHYFLNRKEYISAHKVVYSATLNNNIPWSPTGCEHSVHVSNFLFSVIKCLPTTGVLCAVC